MKTQVLAPVLRGSLVLLAVVLAGCLPEFDSGSESGTIVVTEPGAPPLSDPERTICDPFNQGPVARDRGLIGHLLYADQVNQSPSNWTVEDYMDQAHVIQNQLYFDRLYIPTRPFDRGFYLQSGTQVLNHMGEPIYEYFAVRLESELQLTSVEQPGWYQLGLLADDGATLSRKDDGLGEQILVNNDGIHSTKMACGQQPVWLDHNTRIPIVAKYFQGPRYHISLVMLMRPIEGATDPHVVPAVPPESECGRSGNSRYFDSTKDPVVPQTAFYEMQSRGWKVPENGNFYFPEPSYSNPCVPDEEVLAISNFFLVANTRTEVTWKWDSNVAGSSQLEVKNVATGAITFSNEVPGPTTSHQLSVTGLTANTIYSFRAITRTPSGQIAYSDERAIRTPR